MEPSGRREHDALGGQHGSAVGGQDDAGQVVLPRGQEDKTLCVSGTLLLKFTMHYRWQMSGLMYIRTPHDV